MVHIIDTTLREGEQTPGVLFDTHIKKIIIRYLAAIGIDEIELGIASAKETDTWQLARWIRSSLPEQSFSLWCRCCAEDIRFAARLQPSVLALSIPVSDLHLKCKMGQDRAWAKKQLVASIELALSLGVTKVAVGFEDATRADRNFMAELALVARDAGAFRLRLADTVGVASPKLMTELLDLVGGVGLELGVHCHNDFGMATANTVAAIEHGALWADVTVLGLGERAGNSRLEEVVSYLRLQMGVADYSLQPLLQLSKLVARVSGRVVCAARPILGADLFTCETGLHLQGLMADPQTYEPFAPELIGAKRELLIGSKSGCRAIAATMKRLGLPGFDDAMLTRLTRQVRSIALELKRPLVDHEIVKLVSMQVRN